MRRIHIYPTLHLLSFLCTKEHH
ncbi:unnamed protein product, partial [Vitis vinifera]